MKFTLSDEQIKNLEPIACGLLSSVRALMVLADRGNDLSSVAWLSDQCTKLQEVIHELSRKGGF